MRYLLSLICLLSIINLYGQEENRLESISDSKTKVALQQLREFIALPNDANYLEDIDKNIAWLEAAFKAQNFDTKILKFQFWPRNRMK